MPRARWPHCVRGSAPHQAPPRPRPPQAPVKHLLSTLFCCVKESSDENASSEDNSLPDETEGIPLGPLTLEQYIKTLEPYNPAIHGWRGDEPWKLKRRSTIFQCSNGGCGVDANGGLHNNQCLSISADPALYI